MIRLADTTRRRTSGLVWQVGRTVGCACACAGPGDAEPSAREKDPTGALSGGCCAPRELLELKIPRNVPELRRFVTVPSLDAWPRSLHVPAVAWRACQAPRVKRQGGWKTRRRERWQRRTGRGGKGWGQDGGRGRGRGRDRGEGWISAKPRAGRRGGQGCGRRCAAAARLFSRSQVQIRDRSTRSGSRCRRPLARHNPRRPRPRRDRC